MLIASHRGGAGSDSGSFIDGLVRRVQALETSLANVDFKVFSAGAVEAKFDERIEGVRAVPSKIWSRNVLRLHCLPLPVIVTCWPLWMLGCAMSLISLTPRFRLLLIHVVRSLTSLSPMLRLSLFRVPTWMRR